MEEKKTESLVVCHADCGKKAKWEDFMRCSGCHTALYCSHECQKKHWKKHKKDCQMLSALYTDKNPEKLLETFVNRVGIDNGTFKLDTFTKAKENYEKIGKGVMFILFTSIQQCQKVLLEDTLEAKTAPMQYFVEGDKSIVWEQDLVMALKAYNPTKQFVLTVGLALPKEKKSAKIAEIGKILGHETPNENENKLDKDTQVIRQTVVINMMRILNEMNKTP